VIFEILIYRYCLIVHAFALTVADCFGAYFVLDETSALFHMFLSYKGAREKGRLPLLDFFAA